MHGIVMVWFFLIPSIPTTLGNFLLPLMIGARDLAFPRLNLMSWYLFMLGGAFDALRAVRRRRRHRLDLLHAVLDLVFQRPRRASAVIGVFIAGFSSILTGLNFIVTIHRLRAPGLTWFRLPLFVWSLYATAVILVLATPVLAMTLLLHRARTAVRHRHLRSGASAAIRCCSSTCSGSTRIPAVYIMILPGMGVVSEIIPCFSRKPLFGYKFVAWCSIAIAVIGFFVWGHHMFVSGQSVFAGLVFSFMSFIVAVPSAIKVFNWTATHAQGLGPLRRADALCAGVHRAVHHRRADRAVPRLPRL